MKLVHYTVFNEYDMGLSGTKVPFEDVLYVDGAECLRAVGLAGAQQVAGARKAPGFLGVEHEYEHRVVTATAASRGRRMAWRPSRSRRRSMRAIWA